MNNIQKKKKKIQWNLIKYSKNNFQLVYHASYVLCNRMIMQLRNLDNSLRFAAMLFEMQLSKDFVLIC